MNLLSWRTIKGSSIEENLFKEKILLYRNKETPNYTVCLAFPTQRDLWILSKVRAN